MTFDIETIAAELAEAKADVALLQRLNAADRRAAALQKQYDRALAAQDAALEKAAEEARRSRFDGLSNLRVVLEGDPDNLCRTAYRITWTGQQHDSYVGMSVPRQFDIVGFEALPENVFAFLIEQNPEQVPPTIRALAPGDLMEAFERYFRGRRRGYFTSGDGA